MLSLLYFAGEISYAGSENNNSELKSTKDAL